MYVYLFARGKEFCVQNSVLFCFWILAMLLHVLTVLEIHQEDTLPGWHQGAVTLIAGQVGGFGAGGDCGNGEEE